MKLSEFSVKNSLIVNCLSFFLIIWGLFALLKVQREAFPNFSFDIVTVRTDYLGASPDVIEKRITIPLEKELKEVDDIEEMGSVSVEGLSLIVLKIDPDAKNKDKVVTNIERAVQEVSDLPDDLREKPSVDEIETKDTPIVEVSLSGNFTEEQLRRMALDLETELLEISDLSGIARKGMRDPEIWVEVDPEKIKEQDLSFVDIIRALSHRNINVPGGLLKGGEKELILRTNGEFETAEEINRVVLRANEGGHWTQIQDVAKVTQSFEEKQQILRTDGSRAINLFILKKRSGDAIRLLDRVKEVVTEFQKTTLPGLQVAYVNDLSYYIKRRLSVLISNGWIGLGLVIVPMILFLSPGTALGAVMGIGTALLTTFGLMNYFGISINLISMFGMIMVLGMLVDEDLVVADNITRYREMGLSAREAAIKGAAEVGPAILSTVLTTIVAFIPLLFMTGIFGKFVSDIPKVVMITLLASLMEAMIILPSHLASFEKKEKKEFKTKQHHAFDRFRDHYEKLIRWCLDRPLKVTLVSIALMLAAIAYSIFGMDFILFPPKGIEAFFIRAESSVGTRLEIMEEKMKILENLTASLSKNELDHYVTQVGIMQNDPSDPFTTRGSHVAQIEVYLTPETKRDRDADAIIFTLREKLESMNIVSRPENFFQKNNLFPWIFKNIPSAPKNTLFDRVSFDSINPGPPVGKPVAIRIRGESFEKLNDLANTFKSALAKINGVQDIRDDYESGKGEFHIVIDEKKALQAGLNFEEIGLTIRQAFGGMPATKIRRGDEEIDVVVRLPIEKRFDPKSLESLLVKNNRGNMVELSLVASFEEKAGVSMIKHFDSKRSVTVTANVDTKITSSKKVNAELKNTFSGLPSQNPGYSFKYGGEEEDTEKSMESLFKAFGLSMLLIFFILLVTFESVLQTFIIMLSIPFGLVGVVIGFSISGEPFSFLAMLGMIGLTGVVVDGGTLIFVFMNNLRKEGVEFKEAIIQACKIRLRSIILTTITTVVGVIPAAYGIGGEDPFIKPMALALNWGIAVSILFSIIVLPVIYYVAETGMTRLKEKLHVK